MRKKLFLTAERVNFIIALCAILISLASFYATYLQASAAEKQVKAMTLPIVGFEHGNYNEESKQKVISFTMNNSGMGAAIIHKTRLIYNGKPYSSYDDFLKDCCNEEYKNYKTVFNNHTDNNKSHEAIGIISTPINQIVLPAQSDKVFFELYAHKNNQALWQRINRERWKLDVEFCYCTLLDDCFISKGIGLSQSVRNCIAY